MSDAGAHKIIRYAIESVHDAQTAQGHHFTHDCGLHLEVLHCLQSLAHLQMTMDG